MKTEGDTQAWARRSAVWALCLLGLGLAVVLIGMPMINAGIRQLWLSRPAVYVLAAVPVAAALLGILTWVDLRRGSEYRPFFLSVGIFFTGYLGLGISLWPWIIPFAVTFRQAAAAGPSQSLLLVGTLVLLPVILGYTGFCYYLFRGKASHQGVY
jgi:cytochrome d ubiquinol oxidase subunit II